MLDLQSEMMNLNYRELIGSLKDFFPKFNIERVRARFTHLRKINPHETIYSVCKALSEGGYSLILDEQGFWQQGYEKFSGHSHQCCAVLSLVLFSLGFEVTYLEGYRVRDYVPRSGILEKVSPSEEENPKNKEEFIKIRRIPYSCVEVIIKGKSYYISPKHVQVNLENGSLNALLVPDCYIDFAGCFRHQNDALKSGVYLKQIVPEANIEKHNFQKRIVWPKKTFNDERMEFFATFLRIKIE